MALDKQINLYKIDTNAFLTEEEESHRRHLVSLKKERDEIYKKVSAREKTMVKTISKYSAMNEEKLGEPEKKLLELTKLIKPEEKVWKDYILKSAADAVVYNKEHPDAKHIRELNSKYIWYADKETGEKRICVTNVVSMFESTLSRSFGIKTNELTYDIFILEIYYYDIAQDLILNGFNFNGKHYVYFSSSAGQIRTKKAVFVEEQKYNECKLKLMCGLTVDKINEKGGMNINKFLAYVALANSATDVWEDVFNKPFDINKCIVVDDFETMIDTVVDEIDYQTYEITENKHMQIPIPHTDGCGLISSDYCDKNFMVRLPFIKGLLGSFDFKRFISEHNCSPIVKDIWGKEYDVVADDIQIIFTKSQLKMYKYYDSWDQYKEYFNKYNCEACVCNMEEDKISNAHINYQMLQTLYLATDDDIAEMCLSSNNNIDTVSDTLENTLRFYGVYKNDVAEINKDWFQKSLKIYPELLTDPACKQDIKDLKNSYIKRYKGGHLEVLGKFTFVLPDLYAFCEWLFLGIEVPNGVLKNNEVYCRLYPNTRELDCLRSPHLYIEHAVRNNAIVERQIDWFNTDAIYTSTFDPISRILQFDVDGDRLLVLAQRKLVELAKKCSEGVNPLYYEMKKATAEQINNENLYKGLKLAFTGGRIGGISNDITKIWNTPGGITEESKKAIKWLCMETNFTIDYAKTLFKPTRPKKVNEIIKSYTKYKTPYFFTYAKDKELDQVEPVNNSLVNKIGANIHNNRKTYKMNGLAGIDYTLLLSDNFDYCNDDINSVFDKWNKKYGMNLRIDDVNTDINNINVICMELKSLLYRIEPDDDKVMASLVNFLYKKPSSRKKKLMWYLYGEKMYNNLVANLQSPDFCWNCGRRGKELTNGICDKCCKSMIKNGYKIIYCSNEWCRNPVMVKAKNNRACMCDDCRKERNREFTRLRVQKFRENSDVTLSNSALT